LLEELGPAEKVAVLVRQGDVDDDVND